MSRSMRGVFLAGVVAAVLLYVGPSVSLAQQQAPPVSMSTTPSPNVPASQAVPVQQVPSPASPSHASDQVMWGLIVSYAMQYLKKARWFGLLTEETEPRLKAQFGFIVALLTAAGIHFAVTGSVLDGTGASITITGVSLDALKDVAFQWASQQAWYDGIVRKLTATGVNVTV